MNKVEFLQLVDKLILKQTDYSYQNIANALIGYLKSLGRDVGNEAFIDKILKGYCGSCCLLLSYALETQKKPQRYSYTGKPILKHDFQWLFGIYNALLADDFSSKQQNPNYETLLNILTAFQERNILHSNQDLGSVPNSMTDSENTKLSITCSMVLPMLRNDNENIIRYQTDLDLLTEVLSELLVLDRTVIIYSIKKHHDFLLSRYCNCLIYYDINEPKIIIMDFNTDNLTTLINKMMVTYCLPEDVVAIKVYERRPVNACVERYVPNLLSKLQFQLPAVSLYNLACEAILIGCVESFKHYFNLLTISYSDTVPHILFLLANQAVKSQQSEALYFILEHKTPINYLVQGKSIVHSAIKVGDLTIFNSLIDDLVERYSSDTFISLDIHESDCIFIPTHATLNNILNASLITAAKHGQTEMVERLIQYGLAVSVLDDSAIISAVTNGKTETTKFLLQEGALQSETLDIAGLFEIAIRNENVPILSLLAGASSSVDKKRFCLTQQANMLHFAAKTGSVSLVRTLLKHGVPLNILHESKTILDMIKQLYKTDPLKYSSLLRFLNTAGAISSSYHFFPAIENTQHVRNAFQGEYDRSKRTKGPH